MEGCAIRGGEDWRSEIDQAIEAALAVIVVMTPEAKASEYVTYEWAFAWGAKVKVIPVLLKGTQLHPRLESLQYLNFTNRNARPWEELTKVLREAMSSKPKKETRGKEEEIGPEIKGDKEAYERMMVALRDKSREWRSIARLAIIGGVSEEAALQILRVDPSVVFGKSKKTGSRIVKLQTK